jgi:2-polyprenyl-3-methyl-5-hydroxy-6-metoxy-1,4-benzoquinol methylase
MTTQLREALLARYGETQASTANPAVTADPNAASPYFEANYAQLIRDVGRDANVLDIGCGRGGLIAWLRGMGFDSVGGIDASPIDVERANAWLGDSTVALGDAIDHLERSQSQYDLVVAKAILEHIPRNELLRLVRSLAGALRPGGRVLIDVPNMDWLLASHERYMDLTHEGGFTRESLHAYLSLGFDKVEILGSVLAEPTRSQRLLRPVAVRALRRLLYLIGEGASDLAFSSRSLIAVARDPRSDMS